MSLANNRRRRPADDDDEDQRPRQRRNRGSSQRPDQDEEEGGDGTEMDAEPSADEQLAKKLIRYTMSCDFSRTPIRRDGIKDKVLGDQGRAFQRVFKVAQARLRAVWGMELRELPVREKHSLEEKRRAIKSQTQAKSTSSIYVLSTTLPEKYRTAGIIGPSKTPSHDADATYSAFYSIATTVIMLNGGELSDAKLRRYLHRLNAEDNLGLDQTEDVLRRMQTQGYVVRQVQRDAGGTQTQGQHQQDGMENVVWYVGPRAQEEIGVDGASNFIRQVWGEQESDAAEEDLERKIRASFGLKEPEQEGDGEEIDGEAVDGGNDANERG